MRSTARDGVVMLIPAGGFVAATVLFLLLLAREIRRVSATSVGGFSRQGFWEGPLVRRAELLLWVVGTALLAPRIFVLVA